jgi:hypothetical protein
MTTTQPEPQTEPLSLTGEQQEIALAETQAVIAAAKPGDYRERLAGLAASIQEGSLDQEDEIAELDQLLQLSLQAGRIRAHFGPGGEQAALRLYRRLPSGTELTTSAKAVSDALSSLHGAELETASIQAIGPGAYTLTLRAGGVDISVRLDRQGARLASVGV